jgi:NAD(P)H-dependent FMN reductase
MTNVLVVLSSARKGRVADKVSDYVKADLEKRDDVTITTADLAAINMPFFAHELSPANPDYVPTDAAVLQWQKLVTEADAIVWLTPEYNHTINALQKNAIDSLKAEWVGKPIVIVGYGWTGASLSLVTLNEVLPFLEADLKPNPALLGFMKDLNPDGSVLDEASVAEKIKIAIDEIV